MDESRTPLPAAARWVVEFRTVWLVVVSVVTLLCIAGLSRLNFSDNPRDIYARDDAPSRLLAQVQDKFGPDDASIVVVLDGQKLLSRESLARVQGFVELLQARPDLGDVNSVLDARRAVRLGGRTNYWMIVPPADREGVDYQQVREQLLAHPAIARRMLSADGRTMIVAAQMAGEVTEVEQIARVVAGVEQAADKAFGGSSIRARLTGQPSLRVDTFYHLKSDQLKFCIICGATLFLVALALFRRLQPVIVSLAGPGIGVLWTFGAMGWAGQRLDGINVVLPTLLLVIGFTDSLHLVAAIRRLRRAGKSPRDAASGALAELLRPCLLTSLTTAVGFGSLTLSSLLSVHRFGLYAGLGVMALYGAVLTIVPLLSMAPWFRDIVGPHQREHHVSRPALASLGRLVSRAPTVVSLLGIVVLAALAAAGRGVPFDMRWSEALNEASETVAATRHLDRQLGGSVLAHVVIHWPAGQDLRSDAVLRYLAHVHQALEPFSQATATASRTTSRSTGEGSQPVRLGAPSSLLTVLQGLQGPGDSLAECVARLERRAPAVLQRFVDVPGRQLLVSLPLPDAGAAALLPVFNDIERQLSQISASEPGFSAQLTGTTVLSARNLSQVLRELVQSVSLAAVVVFVILCLAFRSLRLGLVSIVPNSLPLLVTIAYLQFTGEPMQVTAALTLCLALGIAVDDTIHFVTRFRREQSEGNSLQQACVGTYQSVGEVIVMTTVVLVCGFATMALSGSPAIRLFGVLSCVTLVAALVGDLLFLPALLLLVGPRSSGRPMADASPADVQSSSGAPSSDALPPDTSPGESSPKGPAAAGNPSIKYQPTK